MTIFGVDMSHYDAAPSNLGARLVAEGFRFITHKAGGDANDAELSDWWGAVKGQRGSLLTGAYWVLYPGSPVARADSFLSRLDSQCPGWRDGPFILQVDCEKWGGDSGTVPPKSDIKAFCDRLVSKMPKLTPIVYGPQWVYGNTLSGLAYPLWASSYVSGSGTASGLYPGDSSPKWGSYSGQTPAVLQYSSSATVAGQTTCDVNAFRGSVDQLTALLAPGWKTEVADVPLTSDDVATILNTDGVIAAPAGSKNSDGTDNLYWSLSTYVKNTYSASVSARTYASQALAAASLPASVDVDALAALLAPKISGMTESEIKDALKDALREGTGDAA